MQTARVRIRNMSAQAQGLPVLYQVKVKGEVLPPGEEREFEFTEEDDLKVKVALTKEGEEFKKSVEEGDAAVEQEHGGKKGEKKETLTAAPKAEAPGQAQSHPASRR